MRYTEYFFTLLQAKEMPQLGNVEKCAVPVEGD